MNNYQICKKCISDTSDLSIYFDTNGVCNHCKDWLPRIDKLPRDKATEDSNLVSIAKKIKTAGSKNQYDCMIGLSGGVDSSYIVHLAYKLALKPLIIHFDNGWNSELAISNIEKLVKKCNFELQTLVVDWEEFRDLQKAYLRASVIDVEVPTDHAIIATMFKSAKKYKIKYILSGGNIATESGMPEAWTWPKKDLTNLKNIHSKYSKTPLKSYPTRSIWEDIFVKKLNTGVKDIRILDHINYSKTKAIKTLEEQYDWKYYGGKHYESVFTKFYQAYILPTKFGIDKRRVHLSSLIRNSEITRDQALEEMSKDIYPQNELYEEKEYVLKKLGFSSKEFDEIMSKKPKDHIEFGSDYNNLNKLKKIYRKFKR
jgi:N-acetyl sugar amidotransferase